MKKRKLPVSVFELVAYITTGLMGLWALTYICLGIACEFISSKSALYKANKSFSLSFLNQGLIILAVAVVAAVVVLLVNAKKSDRDFEKAQRRAARLAKDNKVIDAEVETAE